MSNIYLIGMMGCGKSTIAKILAAKTGKKRIDLDREIENEQGCSISSIFDNKGEKYFRETETQILKKISAQNNCIIACGGGIILNPLNIKIMRENGHIIYLERKTTNILKNIDTSKRPLLKSGAQNLDSIYEKRKPLYEAAADIVIENDGELAETATKIIECYPDFFSVTPHK